ncbi:ribosomal protein S12 methylthiotransferase accessory factor [Lentzea atacamensis]|uniref:Ribosomal protein S12 methylthiotransferase accessory factor n=1 Tax=Lentzea atacamensis TaxID=531938 RepID=A0A316I775_9PSEU|nr:YcaO-like family protein [Lentzea atacamensis]PWK88358.1 ribosomal protein S12 methylthiotransferase accessory factor [Lentzea atacamensis]
MISYSLNDPPHLRADGSLVLIGPTSGACTKCAEDARLEVAGPEVPGHDREMRLGGLVPPAFLPLIDELREQEHEGTVTAIRTDLAVVSTHQVRPRCDHCTPDYATPAETEVPVSKNQLRSANPLTTVDNLKAATADFRHGPVTALYRTGHLPLATVTAELTGHAAGHGRAPTFEDAERVAFFEAVERYNGMRPRKRQAITQASFADLGPDKALDPERVGLCDFDQRYTPDLRMRWVQAWSYMHQRPTLVPEQVAYWDAPTPPEQRFLYETSNGCGLGNSLTEAVLHGLFEVAERDAFLMAWYAKTPLRRIRLPQDPLLPHYIDRLEELGYELLFLDATNDIGIPAVLSIARTDGHGLPQAFFAAGASPDPVAALRSAAAEVVVDVESFTRRPRDLRELLEDPAKVRSMEDHVAVNTLPEAAERYVFLVSDDEPTELEDKRDHTDLRALLDAYTEQLGSQNLEVIAVDQSDPVTARGLGLYSAKVIVPGTLPMTFGHLLRRTHGLPRLPHVRNPHPHPFP